jgi:hypothetical protein
MVEDIKEQSLIVRVDVETAGVWRAEQVASTLLAIDKIAARVGIASYISETCEAYDHVIRHMGMFGLLDKKPENWGKPKTPTDLEVRSGLASFISLMRNAGVNVKVTHLGVDFSFLVDDLSDILPVSSRAEIDRISMSSPGVWSLLLTGAIKSEGAFHFLEKIFDSIFYRESIKRKKAAEARLIESQAELNKANARKERARAKREEILAQQEKQSLILDYVVAVDSLILALRNCGFDNKQIYSVLRDRLMSDIDLLARHKSLGLINNIRVSISENTSDANL